MSKEKIELTQQELEDLKDTVKFRTMVVLEIKRLRDVPNIVNSLKTQSIFQWAILAIILSSLLGTVVIRAMAG